MIRKLLTLGGRRGGRLSVVDYGDGLSIAVATPPIELVVGLDADQAAELLTTLGDWLNTVPREASVQR